MSRPLRDVPVLPAKLGRPRAKEQGSTVSTWLRPGDHDRLIQLANQQEVTISALVRSLLILRLR